jgi:hypothetical protein
LASAAAMPPSAMTVCAFPRRDLVMTLVFAPLAGLDGGPKPGAARADDHHVVIDNREIHQNNR